MSCAFPSAGAAAVAAGAVRVGRRAGGALTLALVTLASTAFPLAMRLSALEAAALVLEVVVVAMLMLRCCCCCCC